MKTFKQYLTEQLWTAIKLPDGTIKRGKFPHSSHEEIRDKHGLEITKGHQMGFVMVKDGKKTFMDRSEAAKHVGRQTDRADSTHLKPRDQTNRDDDPFAGSYASTDAIKSNVAALKKELEYAKEEALMEANLTDKQIADMANANDAMLDKKYGYGRSRISPIRGRNKAFGAAANFNSAQAGLLAAMRSKGNLRATSDAIHRGWGKTVDTHPAAEPKQSARMKLKRTPYFKLSRDEQGKDDEIAQNIIKRLKSRKRKKK